MDREVRATRPVKRSANCWTSTVASAPSSIAAAFSCGTYTYTRSRSTCAMRKSGSPLPPAAPEPALPVLALSPPEPPAGLPGDVPVDGSALPEPPPPPPPPRLAPAALISAPSSKLRAVMIPSKGARTCSKRCSATRRRTLASEARTFSSAAPTLALAEASAASALW